MSTRSSTQTKNSFSLALRRREAFAILFAVCLTFSFVVRSAAGSPRQPNILWISSEDHGPHMGCYGDRFATTPNVDRLAARGIVYTHCWSNAPVCAPARTTII